MTTKKQFIREKFRMTVLDRDDFKCKCCGDTEGPFDAHHITDRNEMPNGGYVKENGITICESCHKKAEVWHSSNKTKYELGYHPDDLYKLIKSTYELAVKKSERFV